MTHDDKDQPKIPEPTTIEQAADDGIAERIASSDTEGGSDQFTNADDHAEESERGTSTNDTLHNRL